jgi:hypothetical protein
MVSFRFAFQSPQGYRVGVNNLYCKSQRTLHVGLAWLVVAATSHCAWEGHAALAHFAAAAPLLSPGDALPLEAQPGCHNESGCICRGATQVVVVDVSGLAARYSGLMAPVAVRPFIERPRLRSFQTADAFEPRVIVSGRALRALIASLLI